MIYVKYGLIKKKRLTYFVNSLCNNNLINTIFSHFNRLLSELLPQTRNIVNVLYVNREMWSRMNQVFENNTDITNSAIEDMLGEKNDEIADISDISIASIFCNND